MKVLFSLVLSSFMLNLSAHAGRPKNRADNISSSFQYRGFEKNVMEKRKQKQEEEEKTQKVHGSMGLEKKPINLKERPKK